MKWKANTALRPLARGIAVSVGLMLATPVLAQVAPVQIPGRTPQDVNPAERTPAVAPALINPGSFAVVGECAFAGKGQVTLTRIEVTGATLVSREAIDQALADLTGHPADAAILCTARDRVATVYARAGEALAAVDIPQQTMTDGVLTLRVTEGHIRNVVIENEAALGPSAALVRATLGALDNGGATRWSDVERAFLLTREIPGVDVRFALRRMADDSDDGLEVVVTAAPRRKLDIGIGADNLGSWELGRESASLRIDANSFTRFGERTSLVLYSSFGGEQKVGQVLGEVRLGAAGWVAFGDYSQGRSQPGGALEVLELDGESKVARLGARYPWNKTRGLSLDVGARIEAIDQTNDVGFLRAFGFGDIPLLDEQLRVLALNADARWQRMGTGLSAHASLEVRKGLSMWGASDAGDALLSRADGDPEFVSAKLGLGARWSRDPSAWATPYFGIDGAAQWSNAPLPAYEEFQVGNYTIGRGFDPGAAAGDSAVAAQFETGVDFRGNNAAASVFAFFDSAYVWNRDRFSDDTGLRSVGLGARAYTRYGQFTLGWAFPLSGAYSGGPTPESRVLLTYHHTFSIH